MSPNLAPLGTEYSGTVFVQSIHAHERVWSKQQSKTVPLSTGGALVSFTSAKMGCEAPGVERISGTSFLSSCLRKKSNFSREGASTVAPTPQMRAKKKRPCRISVPFFESGARLGCSGTSIQMSRCASMKRMTATASMMSIVGTGERQSLRRYQRIGSRNQSKSTLSDWRWAWSTFLGSFCSHEVSTGCQPSECGSMYTMPQRETVAGDATARSIGSKMRFMMRDMAMISPLIKQSFLLSSSTVFMFSIQTASTGPSKTIHWRTPVVSCAHVR